MAMKRKPGATSSSRRSMSRACMRAIHSSSRRSSSARSSATVIAAAGYRAASVQRAAAGAAASAGGWLDLRVADRAGGRALRGQALPGGGHDVVECRAGEQAASGRGKDVGGLELREVVQVVRGQEPFV